MSGHPSRPRPAGAARAASGDGVLGAIGGGADTIAAIATPAGRGAIALVRMSGPAAEHIAGRVVFPWPTVSRVATLATIRDPQS